MTETELRLIAAAAIMGLSSTPNTGYSTPAAMGIPSTLYMKAKNRFCLMFCITPWLSRRTFENAAQVALEERDAGALDGHIRAGAHGDSDLGLCQCGRIVDAVARHGNGATLLLKAFYDEVLLVRQNLSFHFIQAKFPRYRFGGRPVVTGEHDDPDSVPFEDAHRFDGRLIHAAAGGVGSMAVQLAKAHGARVIGTASGPEHIDLIRKLGCDEAIDYKAIRFEDQVRDVDVVLDPIRAGSQRRSFGVLKKGGILVSLTEEPRQDLARQYGVRATMIGVKPDGRRLADIGKIIDDGKISSLVQAVLPLEWAKEALELSRSRHAAGKVVLTI
jgi:hypothetical protein